MPSRSNTQLSQSLPAGVRFIDPMPWICPPGLHARRSAQAAGRRRPSHRHSGAAAGATGAGREPGKLRTMSCSSAGAAGSLSATDPCIHCGFCLPSLRQLPGAGHGDGFAAGADPHAQGDRSWRAGPRCHGGGAFRFLSGLPGLRQRLPVGGALRRTDRSHAAELNAPELRSPWQNSFRPCCSACCPTPSACGPCCSRCGFTPAAPCRIWRDAADSPACSGPEIAAMERLLPAAERRGVQRSLPAVVPATGPRRYRVGLVLGCVQRLFDPAVTSAAVRVLSANGIEVVIPPDQNCCGAMTHHQGELEQTQGLAKDLIDCFEAVVGAGKAAGPEPLDAVLVTASGLRPHPQEIRRAAGRQPRLGGPPPGLHRSGGRCAGIPRSGRTERTLRRPSSSRSGTATHSGGRRSGPCAWPITTPAT